MNRYRLILLLLLVFCFAIAAKLEPRQQAWMGTRRDNTLALLMGDSRRMFANHFYTKADVYFHGGYYPSIFDKPMEEEKGHLEHASKGTHVCDHDHDHESDPNHEHLHEEAKKKVNGSFLGSTPDWIDAFGRNFYPSKHIHLSARDEREMLPWLRMTAEMDPKKVEVYTVASYTLRKHLGKTDEAEAFLRQGLRNNPESYEILFELGRIKAEDRKDAQSARKLWEVALDKWDQQQAQSLEPDSFVRSQILGSLARLEEEQGNYQRAIACFEEILKMNPHRTSVLDRIQELRDLQREASK